jgi:hypothetical protein
MFLIFSTNIVKLLKNLTDTNLTATLFLGWREYKVMFGRAHWEKPELFWRSHNLCSFKSALALPFSMKNDFKRLLLLNVW